MEIEKQRHSVGREREEEGRGERCNQARQAIYKYEYK